ncbi:MAG TPA: MerR family transcriptional regulator [Allosphingosinicella sp.]|nr:MerR family transcriptional regulator [Allosphingosinicella sp.]
MQLLDIAEVARRSSVPASALRFYEEKGLIASLGRRGQRRLFEPAVIERLALIALARAAGFSLDEIAETFPAGRGAIDRARLTAKAEELEARIQRLAAISEGLRHAAECPKPSHFDCPSFRRLLGLAASGALSPLTASPSSRRRPPHRG